jgi:hypothetical protein
MFELSDFEEVKLTQSQFQEWHKLGTAQLNALWRIAEILTLLKDRQQEVLEAASADLTKWLAIQNQTFTAGFASVVEAIAKLQPLPNPQPEPDPFIPLVIEPEKGFVEIGDIRFMQITDSQQFKITFAEPVDKKGFKAKVQEGSVSITVGNDTATVEPNPDEPTNVFSALVKGARPGADDGSEVTAVTISADADLGEGVKAISKALELQVTSGEASGFGEPTVGTVEEQA